METQQNESKEKQKDTTQSLIVQRRNIFDYLSGVEFTSHEYRFFLMTFALINPKNEDITDIYFPLDTYKEILGIKNLDDLEINKITDKFFNMAIKLPTGPNGEEELYHLYSACGKIYDNDLQKLLIHFKIDQSSKELYFNYSKNFTQFPLGGPFLLKRDTQFTFYCLLKEHQYQGSWTVEFEQLKELLGCKGYKKWADFDRRILKEYQKKFSSTCDICFEYKKIQSGKEHSVTQIVFTIKQNPEFKDPFTDDMKDLIKLANKKAVVSAIGKKKESYKGPKEMTKKEREEICAGSSDVPEFDLFKNENEFKLAVDYAARLIDTKYKNYLEHHMEAIRSKPVAMQYAVDDFLQSKLWEIERLNYQRQKGVSKAQPITNKVAYLLGMLSQDLYDNNKK